jgi:DNA-binding transcriptional regulator YiaG
MTGVKPMSKKEKQKLLRAKQAAAKREAERAADEYRALIDQLGLSQITAAKLLGVDPRTSRRWASGAVAYHSSAQSFLRYLVKTGESGDEAMRVLRARNRQLKHN